MNAHVAQLVEHVLGKDEVTRSIRVVGSIPSFAWAAPFDQMGADMCFTSRKLCLRRL
jgi:hypothetical protein